MTATGYRRHLVEANLRVTAPRRSPDRDPHEASIPVEHDRRPSPVLSHIAPRPNVCSAALVEKPGPARKPNATCCYAIRAQPGLQVEPQYIRNMGGSDMAITLVVNGIAHTVDVEPETPLLWVLRDSLEAHRHQILLRHRAVRRLHGAHRRPGDPLVQLPGVGRRRQRPSPPSRGCRRTGRTRCNWRGSSTTCRNAATASPGRSWPRWRCSSRSRSRPTPTSTPMMTNICRCGTYLRIRQAIHKAAELQA